MLQNSNNQQFDKIQNMMGSLPYSNGNEVSAIENYKEKDEEKNVVEGWVEVMESNTNLN